MLTSSLWVVMNTDGASSIPALIRVAWSAGCRGCSVPRRPRRRGFFLDDAVGHALLAQGGGGGLAHPTATENEHRRGAAVPLSPTQSLYEASCASEPASRSTVLDSTSVSGWGRLNPPRFHRPTTLMPVAWREFRIDLPHQGRAHGRGLGDDQVLEAADVGAGVRAQGAPGEQAGEHVHELEHMAAPGQAEDVHRVLQVGIGDNTDTFRADLAHRVDGVVFFMSSFRATTRAARSTWARR